MSEQDDIRRALEELSRHPPMRDRRRAVHERIGVIRRRHNIVTGVTLTVFVLFAGIAFAAIPTGRHGRRSAVLAITPTPLPAPAPTPSPQSSSSRAAASRPARATVAAGKAAPGATEAPKNVSPGAGATTTARPPVIAAGPQPSVVTQTVTVLGTQAATSQPARPSAPAKSTAGATAPTTASSSAGASGGTLSSSTPLSSASAPAEALAADVLTSTVDDGTRSPETTVVVRLHGALYGSVEGVTVWFTTLHNLTYTDGANRPCTVGDGALHPVDETYTFRTRYRAAGDQQIDVAVTSADAACDKDATKREWALSGTATIPIASSLSNGVRPVSLFVDDVAVQDSKITLTTRANDADGFVSGFVVDWGTGTPQSFAGGNLASCAATENGGVFWPTGSGGGAFTSPVLPAGTRTVTVTATSTGCDGTAVQTTQQTLTVTIPS